MFPPTLLPSFLSSFPPPSLPCPALPCPPQTLLLSLLNLSLFYPHLLRWENLLKMKMNCPLISTRRTRDKWQNLLESIRRPNTGFRRSDPSLDFCLFSFFIVIIMIMIQAVGLITSILVWLEFCLPLSMSSFFLLVFLSLRFLYNSLLLFLFLFSYLLFHSNFFCFPFITPLTCNRLLIVRFRSFLCLTVALCSLLSNFSVYTTKLCVFL